MDKFIIEGNNFLKGSIDIKGSKNEAFQIICASLLTEKPVIINNVPNILDINKILKLLELIGVQVKNLNSKNNKFHTKSNSYEIVAKNIDKKFFDNKEFIEYAKKIRGSVLLISPLLHRIKKIKLPKPGGDKIGRRPLNTHFRALQKLGVSISYDNRNQIYEIERSKLIGSKILLEEASVTGTANIIMAAVLAEGKTSIFNAACEPYIYQLCNMLNNMGALIKGGGTNYLEIEGVKNLSGTDHTLMPDLIELGSFIGLSSAVKSNLKINNVPEDFIDPIVNGFSKIGIQVTKENNSIQVVSQKNIIQKQIDGTITILQDNPWPGFPPDLISIAIIAAVNAHGTILIKQRMFESRLFFVDILIDMGAQIILCDPHRVLINGLNDKSQLNATNMKSPDIRAGLALMIAALSAHGISTIENIEQIDRGYENIEERLSNIGANIKRIKS